MSTTQQYQEKFISQEEAIADAKKVSKQLGKHLFVIQSKSIYYVDEAGPKHKHETLIASYENGRKVELPKVEAKAPVVAAPVVAAKAEKRETMRFSKGDGVKTDITFDLKHLLIAAKALRTEKLKYYGLQLKSYGLKS